MSLSRRTLTETMKNKRKEKKYMLKTDLHG